MLERKQLGHYRLMQRLGGGGMGDIYLAQDMRIERQVALKMVRAEVEPYPDAQASADKQRLFLREMQAITRLDHPHILPLYDFGEERDGNNIITYMVMPYRPEGSLVDWLQKRGSVARLSFRDVAYFVEQAAQALQHAHDHGLIHQDVKASNFLVRDHPGYPLPDLLLSDFGIARMMSATSTASQNVRGTPTSMAPEQWQGHPEPATDQYALAIMAYLLLTGRPPFTGRLEQLLHQHLSVAPQPPSALNPAIPRDLDSVILTALNKLPARRFGSVTAFARAFQQAAAVSGFALPAPASPPFSVSSPAQESGPPAAGIVPAPSVPPAPVYAVARDSQPRLLAVPPVTPDPLNSAPTIASSSSPQYPQQPVILPPVQEQPPATYPPLQEQPPAVYPPVYQGQSAPAYPAYQAQSTPAYPPYQGQSAPVYPPAPYTQTAGPQPLPANRAPRRKLVWALLAAALALVLIVSGIGFAYQNHLSQVNAQATADTQSTANTQSTSVAHATQVVQATATAAASQATASALATVGAQATATAQTVINNPYPSYMSGSGTLVLFDPLQGPDNWRNSSNSSFGGTCQFTNGSFHVSQDQPQRFYYCPDSAAFGNFALEVQMNIIQGDCGGVVIRSSGDKLYYFTICADGSYSVWKFVDTSGSDATRLTNGNSGSISSSGVNVVGLLANGPAMTLYVNRQQVASVDDSSFASGTIAFVAQDTTNPTEVAYSNARIWA
jgi:serine/threonine protein kinase